MKKRLKVLITMMLAFILTMGISASASAKTTKTYKSTTQNILRLASTDPDMPIQK